MNTQTLLNNVHTINPDNAIIVNAKEFLKAIKFVAVAVSKQMLRPTLMDVHVEIGENQLTLEATDSHILTQLKVSASVSDEFVGKEFLINGKFAKNLSKTPTKHGVHLAIEPTFNEKGCATGLVKIVDGNNEIFIDNHVGYEGFYPELENLIPWTKDYSFEITKKELLPVLRELKKSEAIMESCNGKKIPMIHMTMYNNKVIFNDKLVSENILQFKENDENKFKITFNFKYLMSMVQQFDNSEKIRFEFTRSLRPFTLNRENGGVGIITPIRSFK